MCERRSKSPQLAPNVTIFTSASGYIRARDDGKKAHLQPGGAIRFDNEKVRSRVRQILIERHRSHQVSGMRQLARLMLIPRLEQDAIECLRGVQVGRVAESVVPERAPDAIPDRISMPAKSRGMLPG